MGSTEPKPKKLWVFELGDGEFACVECRIKSHAKAAKKFEKDYGDTVVKSRLVSVPWDEYRALLACNLDSTLGQAMYQAVLRAIFVCG